MKKAICLFAFCLAPFALFGAACNVPNLVRCLDSACVADASMEPGARCAQCGTAEAQAIINQKSTYQFGARRQPQMRALGGRPAATSLDLEKAPDDPTERFGWAATECIGKFPGCTASDVSKNYDKLIEQSCTAVLTAQEFADSLKTAATKKTESECTGEIQSCIAADNGCGAGWAKCSGDPDFDRVFSACMISTNCGHLDMNTIRDDTKKTRDEYFAARDSNLEQLVAQHAQRRGAELAQAKANCTSGAAKQACIGTICSFLPNGCIDDASEMQYSNNICRYVEIACDRLK